MKKTGNAKNRFAVIAVLIAVIVLLCGSFAPLYADETDTSVSIKQRDDSQSDSNVSGDNTGDENDDGKDSAPSDEETKSDESSEEDEEEPVEVNISTSIWDKIAIPFGAILKFFYGIFKNYAVALLFFAIVMKMLLFVFGIKQQKNTVKQASLRPKEMAIRKKYAGRTDKVTQQKVNEEIMALYKTENFNPMGGCLPLLLQFPILLALFRVVYNPLQHIVGLSLNQVNEIGQILANNGFIKEKVAYDINIVQNINADNINLISGVSDKLTTISDLPKISLFGLDLTASPMGSGGWLWVIPVLTFAAMYFSMKITRKMTYQSTQTEDAAKSMKIMDFLMPAFSTYLSMTFPSILGIYWIYQNVLSVAQQYILKLMYPIPVFTEDDYKEAERILNGKQKKKKKPQLSDSSGGDAPKKPRNPNSLHHIDDDDDDDYTSPPVRKTPTVVNSPIEHAKMKEDPWDEDVKEKKEKKKKKKDDDLQ